MQDCGGRRVAGVLRGFLFLNFIYDNNNNDSKKKTHSGLCWFDFLEMFSQLLFAAECSQALWTFIANELNSL